MLRAKFFTSEEVAAIARDHRTAGLPPAEVALLALAEKVVRNAKTLTREDINTLRSHGFRDEQVFEVILTAASRSFFSRVVDAVGYRPAEGWLRQTEGLLGRDTLPSSDGRLLVRKALNLGLACFGPS